MKGKSLKSAFWERNKALFVVALIAEMIMQGMNILLSYFLQVVTDIAAGIDGSGSLKTVAIEVGAMFITMGVVGTIAAKTKLKFITKGVKQYKSRLFEGITMKGISAFRGENTSKYTSALTNDIAVIEENYVASNFDIVTQIFIFIGALTLMFYSNWVLTLVALGLVLLPVIASVCTGNALVSLEKKVSEKNEGFLGLITEVLEGFSVIKSFKAEDTIRKMVDKNNAELEKAKRVRGTRRYIVSLIGGGAHFVAQIGVFIVGALLCLNGKGITPGMLFMFVNLMNFVIQPVAQLPGIFAKKKAAYALIQKMEEAIAVDDEADTRTEGCTIDEGIKLNNLSFGYEEGNNVINGLSYEFEKGKSYAVVGASGCGKSTMFQLMLAGMDNYSGQIMYDNNELKSISPESLYETVSTIQQNVFVFNASIRDNITMFKDFSKEEVDRVIKLSGLEELIEKKGEDYLCGENGNGLSGGEKQRISIARALLRNSKLLLVDEATAALDAETSNKVINAILKLKDMTRIVITHDLDEASLKQYDSIITLKNGRIVENGNFDKLINDKGYFYSLFTVAS